MPNYKSLLPEYNPDPVFIFEADGNCYFKNTPASEIFKDLQNIKSIDNSIDLTMLIQESFQKSVTYKIDNKYYRIKLVGVKDENIIMAYSQEITELILSMQKEKEAMQNKNDFFRNISHEMKTPLNAIIGLFPLIKKAIAEDKKLLKLFDIVDENSMKLNKLIEKILDIQKIQTNSLVVKNEPFELSPLLTKMFDTYKKNALEKNQEFRVSINNIPKIVIGDASKIIQIIESLLDNAIKFTPDQGIVATKISYNIQTCTLEIIVKDNGIGISKENQEKIFLVQQADASITRKYEGSGLDLFLISNIINLLHGTLSFKSKLTKGTEFTITLPLVV